MHGKRFKNKNQITEKQGVRDTNNYESNLAVDSRQVQVAAATTATVPPSTIKMADRSESSLATADDGHRCRLFVGNLPKAKTKQEIFDEVSRITRGRLMHVITFKNIDNPSMHRGFCFLDYGSAAAAADAKRTLSQHKLFGCKTIVDWADPEPQPDADTMAAVRILFVNQFGGVLDERALARVFGRYGAVDHVKNLKNYAFVHFKRREDAQSAMDALDGSQDVATGVRIDVMWAKPPADKQTRQRMLRDRERRVRKSVPRPSARVASGTDGCAATLASSPTPTADYNEYDHRVYDFGPRQSCERCTPNAVPTTTVESEAASDQRNSVSPSRCGNDGDVRVNQCKAARQDNGDWIMDCPNRSLDQKLLNFFYRMSTSSTKHD